MFASQEPLLQADCHEPVARIGTKSEVLGRRLLVKRHTLPEVPLGGPFPLSCVLLEVGIVFIEDDGRRASRSNAGLAARFGALRPVPRKA